MRTFCSKRPMIAMWLCLVGGVVIVLPTIQARAATGTSPAIPVSCSVSSSAADCSQVQVRVADKSAPSRKSFVAFPCFFQKNAPTLIFGTGDYGSTEPITGLQGILEGAGYSVDVSSTLPANVCAYRAIWYVDTNPLSATDQSALVSYVEAGGGLYLTGERPCCESLDQSDTTVLNGVLLNQHVIAGGQGDVDYANLLENTNPHAIDGLTTSPYNAAKWNPDAPGGMSGVPASNVVSLSSGGIPTGAAWDQKSLAGHLGRIDVQMDINWLESGLTLDNFSSTTELALNIENFLVQGSAAKPVFAGLGDSFSSGEGLGSTGNYLGSSGADGCDRSAEAFPVLAAAAKGISVNQTLFAVCSGAKTGSSADSTNGEGSVLTGDDGEPSQLDYLGPSLREISLTVGGDDFGFTSVLKDCIGYRYVDAHGNTTYQTSLFSNVAKCASDIANAMSVVKGNPAELTNALIDTYTQIIDAAPNAKLYVSTYPQIFPTGSVYSSLSYCQMYASFSIPKIGKYTLGVTKAQVALFNQIEAGLNSGCSKRRCIRRQREWAIWSDPAGGFCCAIRRALASLRRRLSRGKLLPSRESSWHRATS